MFQDSEIDAITTGDPFGCPPHGKYEKLISLAKQVPPATTVVVYPCDETSLRGGGTGHHRSHSGWSSGQNYRCGQATWDRYGSL
jgi:hypothetical protein